jgi:hypothetical protein
MGMQIGAKNIENLLVLSRFSFLFTWESIKEISIWNYPNNGLWELSKAQLIQPKDLLLNQFQ